MTRAITDDAFTTVGASPYWTYAGTWTTPSDSNANAGGYHSSSSVGATATLTIPSGTGITGVLLLCSRIARTGVASVTVDGFAAASWVQDNFTTAAATTGQTWSVTSVPATNQPVAWQRSAYPPITFSAPAAAHTVVITVVTGPVTVDAAECYTSEAMVVGRVTSLGTSITSGSDLGSALTQRFSALAAAAVGGTDDNHSFAGSALIYHTGTSNTVVGAVGWQQAEGSIGSVNGNMTGCLVTTPGTGYTTVPAVAYSAPQDPRGVTATGSCTLSGTTVQFMTITQGGSGYTSGPTVAFSGGGGSGAAAGPGTFTNLDVYTSGAHSWGRDPEWLLLHHGVNDYNTFAGSDPGGGVGYVRELYKQRVREAIWRTNLNSPTTTVLLLGIGYVNDGGVNNTGRQLYSAALAGIAAEPTMVNTRYVDTYSNFINRGGNALFVTSGGTTIHPNAAGHAVIAEAVVAAMFAARARPGGRVLAF